jgi:hypothetical protein
LKSCCFSVQIHMFGRISKPSLIRDYSQLTTRKPTFLISTVCIEAMPNHQRYYNKLLESKH